MNFQIRCASLDDAPALADLLRGIGLFHAINDAPHKETIGNVTRELALCLADSSHSVWVAANGADLRGYLAAHWLPYLIHAGPEGYISELFIAESARGQGIGSALLDVAVAEARRRGCRRLSLLNMRGRESYLRGFYKKHGWEEREDAANFILFL